MKIENLKNLVLFEAENLAVRNKKFNENLREIIRIKKELEKIYTEKKEEANVSVLKLVDKY